VWSIRLLDSWTFHSHAGIQRQEEFTSVNRAGLAKVSTDSGDCNAGTSELKNILEIKIALRLRLTI